MVLSRNSWHYKLFRFAYGTSANEPTNLCPYVWKRIVLGGIFVVITFPIWVLPFIITKILGDFMDDDKKPPTPKEDGILSWILLMYFVIDFVVFCAVYVIVALSSLIFSFNGGNLAITGWISICIGIIIPVSLYFHNRYKRFKFKKLGEKKGNRPNIITSAVKAWYKKHCPLVTWEDD